jgi:single-strand DNA-binding protein
LAEVAERFLKKGGQVYIEGKLTTRSYDDKDGIKRYVAEVVGREMTLLGRPTGEGGAQSGGDNMSNESNKTDSDSSTAESNETDIDDLPF